MIVMITPRHLFTLGELAAFEKKSNTKSNSFCEKHTDKSRVIYK